MVINFKTVIFDIVRLVRVVNQKHLNTQIMLNPKVLRLHKDGSLIEHRKTVESLPIGCVMHYPTPNGQHIGWVVGELVDGYQRVIFDAHCGYIENTIRLSQTEPISEQFGIGMYYDDDMATVSLDAVEMAKSQYLIDEEKRKQSEITKAQKDLETRESLKEQYSFLTVLTDYYDWKMAKKNLVKLLKINFPKTKFSVRRNYYDSFTVEWTDGAPKNSVEIITKMFQGYSFDQSGDFYDHDPSIFNRLFGNFKFINLIRNFSEPIENVKNEVKEFIKSNTERSWDAGSIAYQVNYHLFNQLDLSEFKVDSDGKPSKNIIVSYPENNAVACEMRELYSVEITDK